MSRWTNDNTHTQQRTSTSLVFRGRHVIGASLWQTPGGVQAELERINSDMQVFSTEITNAVRALGYPVEDPATIPISNAERFAKLYEALDHMGISAGSGDAVTHTISTIEEAGKRILEAAHRASDHPVPALVTFFRNVWLPFIHQWLVFFEANKGWLDNLWWNHAPEAEQFLDQLAQIRQTARVVGMQVLSPEPGTFGKSILDPKNSLGNPLGQFADILKYSLYAALGLGGVAVASMIVSNFKKNGRSRD